jgi:23S rRNA-/tRNA-specific pseudouridylate synthase
VLHVLQAMAGHPIVGDPEYCQLPEVKPEDVFEGWMLHGMYLFAAELRFQHPVLDSQELSFCVQPPKKFEEPVGRREKKRRQRQQQEKE